MGRFLGKKSIRTVSVSSLCLIRAVRRTNANTVAAGDELQHAAHQFEVGRGIHGQPPGTAVNLWPLKHTHRPMGRQLGHQIFHRVHRYVVGLIDHKAGFNACHYRRRGDAAGGRGSSDYRRTRRCLVTGQFGQARGDRSHRRRVGATITAMPGQHVFEYVTGIQKGVDHLAAQAKLTLAQAIEQILKNVRDVLQIGKAECSAGALDRMGGAKDGVHLLAIGILDVEFQQQGLHVRQMFLSFLKEDLVELAHVNGHVASVNIGLRIRVPAPQRQHGETLCLTDDFLDHFNQLLRIEGLDQPACRTGRLALRLHGIR